MQTINYQKFWDLVDDLDIHFNNKFERCKYIQVLCDGKYFEYIREIHKQSSVKALEIVAILYLLQKYTTCWVYINTKEKNLVSITNNITTIRNIVNYKYCKKRIKPSKFIEYD